jgi:hypothetical protein
MAQKKLGFVEVSGISMVPRTYAFSEILRKTPTLTDAVALIQADGAECKIGKGYASFQFFDLLGSAGAQELAKASYLASAINAARPPHMFEQIASVRGAAVSVDIHLLRKMREILHAQYVLNEIHVQKSVSVHQDSQALDMLESLIQERHTRAAPIQEGLSEKSHHRKVSDSVHY